MAKSIKVLIVDDQALIRQLLHSILSQDPDIEVIGTAVDPFDARKKIKQLNPDVITLDIEMPQMDGITFLKNLMRLRPTPVVMISTLTEKGADITLEALEIGAIDYIPKPKIAVESELPAIASQIIEKVKNAALANLHALEPNTNQEQSRYALKPSTSKQNNRIDLIAIGASTGGTEAIKEVLRRLPNAMPPIVIVQHMPAGFTTSFAARLEQMLDLNVEEFTSKSKQLLPNHIYLANGSQHLSVKEKGSHFFGITDDSEEVNRHKPSVEVLFSAVAKHCKNRAIGVMLTGMGSDGAKGMLSMKNAGAITIAQDEASSVVWGMPRAAAELGATTTILPLQKIGKFLVKQVYEK